MRTLFVLLITVFVAACAQYKIPPPTPGNSSAIQAKWAQHARDIDKIKHWKLNGRIGFRSTGRALSASIIWQQKDDHFNIQLSGPLGQGFMQLAGDSKRMILQRGEELIASSTPQQLLNQELGAFLPLTQARRWVAGHPGNMSSDIPTHQLDNDGNLINFDSEGWTISYQDYRPVNTTPMPHKIILHNTHDKITLIIKSWKIY